MSVRKLEPTAVWNHFADLNAVPRPSKKEERVRQFIIDFGKKLNLPTEVDEIGNVLIRKPATAGMEKRQTVVLQGHLDMVHQKNADTNFDFEKQGIEMVVDGDWVKAKGTTLGADNGMGVAAIMALLSSTDIEHPALEALFTIDEETGMTGALNLRENWLTGSILLNLDVEEDDEIDIGCAGGIDTTVEKAYRILSAEAACKGVELSVRGLKGGHSGMDIHRGRANANKVMVRLLFECAHKYGAVISTMEGGSLRNAIPREAFATLAVENWKGFEQHLKELSKDIKAEYKVNEPGLKIEWKLVECPVDVMHPDDQEEILSALYAMPNGVYRMSPDVEGLVETSSNLAKIVIKDAVFTMMSLQRSAVESSKADIAAAIRACFGNIGARVVHDGAYPGWAPNPKSKILKVAEEVYTNRFKEKPRVVACHAGLECGILGSHYPGMDMISFGPNIRHAHSPDETVSIPSVQKFWGYLLDILKHIPEK